MTTPENPWAWTVATARDELGEGRISVPAYVDALLTRTERARDLGALIDFDPEELRRAARDVDEARRPLSGIPFARKDVFDVAGYPTTAGCTALGERAKTQTAPMIERLLDAGALLGPRTNLHELSFGVTSNNAAFGPVRNPFDPDRVAGGSSGGAAVAVAVGLTPFALGADTGGSVRIPAAYCGIVGFRPTPGRYVGDGVVPVSPTRDTPGVLARSVADIRLVDGVLAATTKAMVPSAGSVRVAVARDLVEDSSAEVREIFEEGLTRLRGAGIELADVTISDLVARANGAGPRICLTEWRDALAAYLGSDYDADAITAALRSPDVQKAWHVAGTFAAERDAYAAALADMHAARGAWENMLQANDAVAIIYPSSAIVAPPIGDDDTTDVDGEARDTFWAISSHGSVAGVIGTPALSLPLRAPGQGLPIGMDVAGAGGNDAVLLDVAAAVESALSQETR